MTARVNKSQPNAIPGNRPLFPFFIAPENEIETRRFGKNRDHSTVIGRATPASSRLRSSRSQRATTSCFSASSSSCERKIVDDIPPTPNAPTMAASVFMAFQLRVRRYVRKSIQRCPLRCIIAESEECGHHECSRSNRHDLVSKRQTQKLDQLPIITSIINVALKRQQFSVFGVGIYSVEKPQNPGESCSAGWKQATEPMNRFFQRRPEGQPSFSSTRIAEKKHVEPDSMRESAVQAVQRMHVGTHEIEVDGLSVYRCSLWDASNVRNDGKPAFLQPRMPLRSLRASDKNQN
ncbi:hypothetical protein G5I_07746 [Acromyrmex echinatior]|uniref:Uncharacterized protein n=1 Tax=Acromyrmex echinatior TaxID=103372 RepID=F4WPM7_ACREC|nr:hypothetical protein G5I_07746 [Acromyrmex echinatior]